MRTKRTLAILVAAALAGSLLTPFTATANSSKAKTVGTDEEGDWGGNSALGTDAAALGAQLGMDLVEAQIGMADKTTVNFIIKVTGLPPSGGWPEVPRYVWGMNVDGEYLELDGKFTNYSRGTCDPTAGTCPPPRDPGMSPFLVRGNCTITEGANLTTCEELGIIEATFDTAEGSITVPVPLEMMNAKPGSKITPALSSFTQQVGGELIAIPAAFVARSDFPADSLRVEKTFKVPGGKKAKKNKKKGKK